MATVSVDWATRRADTGLTIAVLFIVFNLNSYNLFYCYVCMWWGRYTWGSQRKTVRKSVLTFNLYEDFRDWTRDTELALQAPLTYGALSPDLLFNFRFFVLHLPYALSHSQHFHIPAWNPPTSLSLWVTLQIVPMQTAEKCSQFKTLASLLHVGNWRKSILARGKGIYAF